MNKVSTKTKAFLFIPLVIIILAIVLFVVASIIEQPTSRGTVYTLSLVTSLLLFGVAVCPGLIFMVLGTIGAKQEKATGLLILGIFEIGAALSCMFIWMAAMMIGGPSV